MSWYLRFWRGGELCPFTHELSCPVCRLLDSALTIPPSGWWEAEREEKREVGPCQPSDRVSVQGSSSTKKSDLLPLKYM